MTGTRYSHLLTHLRKAALLPVVVGALAVFGLAGCETVLENGVQRQPPATRTAIDEEPRPLPAETETPENKSDATIVVSDPLEAFEHAGRGTVAPETPYQWSGVIFVADTEGRHFELKRGCDVWVLIPDSDDVAGHLESLIGKKVEVFGRVHSDPTIYMRPAISVGNVVGPDGPFVGLALPEYPCPGDPVPPKPAPYYTATLMNGEIAVRGNLIWHAGKPVLSTPSGELAITVPPDAPVAELQRDQAQSGPAAAPSTAAMDVAAIGKWGFTDRGLTLSAREVRPWPFSIVVNRDCGYPAPMSPGIAYPEFAISLEEGQLAAHGDLVADGGQHYLVSSGGKIFLSSGDSAKPEGDAAPRAGYVVIGKWATDGRQILKVAPAQGFFAGQRCPPPPQPMPDNVFLPGEIGAVGTLVWQDGKAFLQTPSGRIRLTMAEATRPVPLPGAMPPDALRAGESGAGAPAPRLSALHVLAVGRWSIRENQLALAVRYLLPWPYPYPMPLGFGYGYGETAPAEGAIGASGVATAGTAVVVPPAR